MKFIKADKSKLNDVYDLVNETIYTIYPKYYPIEVVEFFASLHNKDNILRDIEAGCVRVLVVNDEIVATGTINKNHMTRIFVLPKFQGNGYGKFVIASLENEIMLNYDMVELDASLPAVKIYEHLGYKTVSHEIDPTANDVKLVYEIMNKRLSKIETLINYNGRRFTLSFNTDNGEVSNNTIFNYNQENNVLWADYYGGDIKKGFLIGMVSINGELDFHYQHLNNEGLIRIGKCHSVPKILADGRIEIYEQWQWLNGDASKGSSTLIEVL